MNGGFWLFVSWKSEMRVKIVDFCRLWEADLDVAVPLLLITMGYG